MSHAERRRAEEADHSLFLVMHPKAIETRRQRRQRRSQAVRTGLEVYGIAAMLTWTWNALRGNGG